MTESTFLPIPDRPNFPEEETKTLAYWKEIDAFQESLRQSKGKKPYNFYDGPPFATGLPHYGHILAGTIKDVVCRFAHQRGHHVERRFGWDCHGVPVEGIIDAKLKIKGRADVLNMGIDKYNEECRAVVLQYTQEWRNVVERFGRWIDFDNDYKTMDLSYMESIWWCFKELFDKGLVYRAFRVMAYSTALSTPLSNFEVQLNYKEVSDPSIIVQFKRTDKENSWLLAWTTTPWTLPSNMALCVNPEFDYLVLKVKSSGQEWVVGKDRFAWVCSCTKMDQEADFELLDTVKGATLVGIGYEPLFPFFKEKCAHNKDKVWHVISDKYVTASAGTCIVHQAPAFGEDDYRACVKFGVIEKDGTGMIQPIDEAGCFTADVTDYKGMHVKAADKDIKEALKKNGNLLHNGNEVHNYPHCWRSETPLIYRAIPAWFIKVEDARDKLIANNNQTHWVPSFVKEKRFHNWLMEARDWCVSRNRYWGAPIPLWVSDDFEEVVCIGSVAELEQYTDRKITDLHRHFIDDITIPSKQGKGVLKRVDEVFDCWFESGSMPYSSKHYPFENKEDFENGFPAQFVAEGLDQTRGWFYTLMVLSTHIFNKPAFQNLICNGLVLAADGKKMSKRLKNYPDPMDMCNQYGADAVRMYMCNSPVVRAEPLKFKEEGVKDIVKDVFLPWFNAYRFFVQEVGRYEGEHGKFVPDSSRIKKSTNVMDKWVNACLHHLIKFVREELDAYRLYTVVGGLTKLLEDLTNWYVRLNRDRMRGNNGQEEALTSLCTLYDLLLNLAVLLAPVVPFITEFMYFNLARALPEGHEMKAKSVHFVMIPEFDPEVIDEDIQRAVGSMQKTVELGRVCREQKKVGLKTPLKKMTIFNQDPRFKSDLQPLHSYIEEELNVMEIEYSTDVSQISLSATLNFKLLGKKLGKEMKNVQNAAKELSQEDLLKFEKEGTITICGFEINAEEMSLGRSIKDLTDPNLQPNGDSETLLVLDFTPDPELLKLAACRDVRNRVQRLRKEAKLNHEDPVDMYATVVEAKKDSTLAEALKEKSEYLDGLLRRHLTLEAAPAGAEVIIEESFDVDGDKVKVVITKKA
mmetsp:Transcript_43375/g.92877  ORF Transcript_43375/g.92877 Transcript_43375/m.92877 type:complete len:1082 (-) Transcript_43375:301-3546(-)|eukprot:CAMPEP_0206445966 /NCGR_PEP_ID=MMETSP0324_2-20121206/15845_1 /ASSEMBLY_ACC=CAM_ASM_000836 /TAXON_ID=2866 /ORGANISM="Crypthecodinium cohnii, Strain Seligo" /LENGTH=1081 /DNA_ID=CAMNT_0053914327 /DNA_START=34 /DNA_END=3279 /DNA_ORIENTATION=-